MTKLKRGGVIAALCGMIAAGGGLTVMNQMTEPVAGEPLEYQAVCDEKDYTVMVYMIGSDLESDEEQVMGAGSEDIQEMLEVMTGTEAENINENVNVVLEIGGSYQWEQEELEGITNARFCIDEKGISNLSNLPDTNMGQSRALSDFINYGTQSYPANHYILLFWNHGSGPIEGYGYDVLHNGDTVLLSEMQRGIQESKLAKKKFSIVGFDACLMGNIETAAVLSPFADYMVASPELEPEEGWDYQWLSVFKETEVVPEEIGKEILSSYQEFYEERSVQVALAFLDLSKYEKIEREFGTYFSMLSQEKSSKLISEISKKRKQMLGFGESVTFTDSSQLLDMEQMLQTISPIAWDACEIEEVMEELVVDKVFHGYSNEICGVNIYLPSGSDMMLKESLIKYQKTGFCEKYQEFVLSYGEYLEQGEELNLEEILCSQEQDSLNAEFSPELLQEISAVYLMTVKDVEDIEDCAYVIATDSDVEISGTGEVQAKAEEEYMGLKGEIFCLMEQYNSENHTDYLSPILYEQQLCMMKIRFSEENPDGEIVTIVPVSEERKASKQEYQLHSGDVLTPLYPLFTGENTKKEELKKCENIYQEMYYIGNEIVIEEEWDMIPEVVNVENALCQFGFMIEDNRQQFYYTEPITLEERKVG